MKDKRPNILWFTTDQQRWDTIHALGNEFIDTPTLDKLCSDGVAFTNTYCQSPICTPSRASFMTGRYPSSINANINGASNLPEHCSLVTKRLADSGYNCGLIGKLHITSAWDDHEERMDDGFSSFQYNLSPGHDIEGKSSMYAKWLREEKNIDWHTIFTNNKTTSYYWYKEDAPLELRQTAWCAEKAIDFIENQSKDKPWMLCVNCYDPHPPFDAPVEYVDKYLTKNIPDPIFSDKDIAEGELLDSYYFQSRVKSVDDEVRRQKASYYGMCEIVDMHFGTIVSALEKLNIRDNTIIIFHSDHGESLGDHGYTHKGCRFYEGLVHVPLIVSCPERFRKNVCYKGITELTDIVATLAEICDIDVGNIHGHSLLPVLEGREYVPRSFVRTEYYDVLEETSKFGSSSEGPSGDPSNERGNQSFGEMLFDGRYKLCVYHGNEHGELYDLQIDPDETNNLWDIDSFNALKMRLLLKLFEVSVKGSRPGQTRRGRY